MYMYMYGCKSIYLSIHTYIHTYIYTHIQVFNMKAGGRAASARVRVGGTLSTSALEFAI